MKWKRIYLKVCSINLNQILNLNPKNKTKQNKTNIQIHREFQWNVAKFIYQVQLAKRGSYLSGCRSRFVHATRRFGHFLDRNSEKDIFQNET